MPLKVAFIGAGSVAFTRRLMRDILSVPALQDTVFSFTDISARNLNMVTQLCRRDIEVNKLPAKVLASTRRRLALEGADYVINTARVGGLEAFQTDIDIPLKYGVDQCVGDTLGPGGVMYGQRGIAEMLKWCDDIRQVCPPDVLLLNYGNPNAMLTWAANEFGRVNCVGLCHGVQGGHRLIAELFGLKQDEVDIICAGINHQTWYIQIRHNGKDLTGKLLEKLEKHPLYSRREKCRIDVLKRFGYFSTESNGHLSEYLPWYRKRPKEIRKWIDMEAWILGETGGYLRVCTESRNWFRTDWPKWLKQETPPLTEENRSEEHGSFIIEALETGRCYRGHFNVVNQGVITNLPDGCIVEVPGYVDANGISIPVVGDLPEACAATCSASVRVQEMAVKAAVRGDVMLLKQAVLHDPLTGAVCDPPEVWQMVDEMLIAQAQWLPQYRREIPKARKRLAAETPLGTHKSKGAARLKPRTLGQMRKQAGRMRWLTQASDKASEGKAARK